MRDRINLNGVILDDKINSR